MKYTPGLPLRSYQKKALKHLADNKGGALVLDPGLGKTAIVLNYLAALAQSRHDLIKVLVLGPRNALDTWPAEAAKHIPDGVPVSHELLRAPMTIANRVQRLRDQRDMRHDRPPAPAVHMVITNLDSFSRSHKMPGTKTVTTRAAMTDAVLRGDFDVVVVDEMHRIRHHTSKTSRSITSLSRGNYIRIGLTGTVQPNSIVDYFGQWLFIDPDEFGSSFGAFQSRYCIMGGWMGKEVVGHRNLEDLRQRIGKKAFIVKQEDVLDLPEQIIRRVPVTLSKKEATAYNRMGTELLANLPSGEETFAQNKLVQWLRLRQLTSGVLEGEEVGSTKVDYALDLLEDLIQTGEKTVVFAEFSLDVDRIFDKLTRKNVEGVFVGKIDGKVSDHDRLQVRQTFRDHTGPAVVVAQIRTSAESVNEFVVAKHCIYVSLTSRRDIWEQSKFRFKRLTSDKKQATTLHILHVPDSIDDVVLRAYESKQRMEDLILEDARSVARVEHE